jgi:excinuclease ABC subunit B
MYADKMTDSMKKTIEETNRRREKQLKYNEENNITPTTIKRSIENIMGQTSVADVLRKDKSAYIEKDAADIAADPVIKYMDQSQLEKAIIRTRKEIERVVKELNFVEAARLRDEMLSMEELLNKLKNED